MKFSILKAIAGLALIGSLSGCIGETVEVPPAHRGKISTQSGLKDEVLSPSKVRLSNMCLVCDDLVLAEVSDYKAEESMKLFMPKDQLNLTVEVRGTLATSDAPEDLAMIFSRIPSQPYTKRVSLIDSSVVYQTYAQQVIRERVRSVISEYTIAELMSNRDAISQEISDSVTEGLKGRPIKVLNFGLADLQPPAIIVTAEESRKKREIEIKEAEASKEIGLTKARANLEIATLQQAVDLKEAETQVLVEQKLRQGFSSAYVAQRGLAILEKIAESDNKVVLMPTEALTNPAMMIGMLQEAMTVEPGKSANNAANLLSVEEAAQAAREDDVTNNTVTEVPAVEQ
jgi:hypothetical protein